MPLLPMVKPSPRLMPTKTTGIRRKTLIPFLGVLCGMALGSISATSVAENSVLDKLTVDTKGGLKIATKDKKYAFSLGGFLQWDYDYFNGLHNNDNSGSETKLRRARFIFKGTVDSNFHYVLMPNYNTAKKEVEFLNAFVKYSGYAATDITVGRFKEPFGMETLSSALWLTTIERSMIFNRPRPVDAGLFVDAGLMLSKHKKNYSWALALVDDRVENDSGKDSYAVTGRVTYNPILKTSGGDNHILHLGAAYSDRGVSEGTTYTLNEGIHVNAAQKINLFTTTIDDLKQTGLEFAYQYGRFNLQSEYTDSQAEGDTDGADVDLNTYYAQLSFTLNGSGRKYKKSVFGPPRMKHNSVVELVARRDHTEAEVGSAEKVEANASTIGVNYYLNPHVKIAANYIRADTDNLGPVDDGDALSLRFQFRF